ncbi:sigma-70 family RNA polymerase sigma factor [Paenibacillus melissococcoides]|uniref:Sigma-70 family RNA polymerase sigma factor n=1 Tax=Paenibacillus melissococcoides TaxID=2912268 RepID=A0ABN8UBD5_9BACL|nr:MULTISPECIES: sigma-70 family RNA polymerase sigma factor [Paenibacillus]MEB9895908.1 sigma-70 family RNA polymerase sigma factor [Bacillus cereus]CAH8247089.1 sigma-70 family RNA polymerase sigma factor [Paenibacillus melissococcoides]CAH8716700.1 sigma-70 family RNA polymerase sigma factor [Paenibacillus melissococcoides]CAH8717663.1 sigma-70 family RNA polymerase sigma factor [Paenibacillus melissococcoides]GIO82276.1 DNA-directed RNA polymerase sigma-70 factor [Paenibacillus dendritifor
MLRERYERDELFFHELCDAYFKPVYKYCRKLANSQTGLMDFADECTQNTFLEARKQISKLKNHPNVEGWLFTTARNFVNLSFRAMYLKNKYEVFMSDDINDRLESRNNEIDQIIENAVDVDDLYQEVLMNLSTSEYELYADYYMKKMSIADLARKYNVSANAITTRIYRINKKIRSIVQTLVVSLDL